MLLRRPSSPSSAAPRARAAGASRPTPSHPAAAPAPAASPSTLHSPPSTPPAAGPQPLTGPQDPRWVLSLRVAEALEGPILTPDKRERLLRLGRVLGLTPFDTSLVIAIIQDQARRGYAPPYCPIAAEPQLAMVPLPRHSLAAWAHSARVRRWLAISAFLAALLAVELAVIRWLF